MLGQYNGLQDDGNHVHDNTKQGYVSLPAYLPEQSATLRNSKLALKLGDALRKLKSQQHNHGGRMHSNDFPSADDSSSYLSDGSTDWGSVDSMSSNDLDDSIAKRLEEASEESELQEEVKKTYKEEGVEKIKAQFAEELYATQQELANTVSKVTSLTEENTRLKNNLETTTKKNAQLQDKLESTRKTLDEKDSKIIQLTKGNTQLKNQIRDLRKRLESKNGLEGKLSSIKQDLAAKTKELENTDQKVLKLEREKLSQQTSIDNLTCKVTTLTDENTQLQNGLKSTQESLDKKDSQIGNLNSQLKDKGVQFKELNGKLESKSKELNDIQKQLENKSELENQVKELSGKNKKFSEASTRGKRQGNYAPVSFVLSSAFAVGAGLTMFHLAICISLAVASLTFLTVGCYCSYKANTALSNVEIDNCVNPAVAEV